MTTIQDLDEESEESVTNAGLEPEDNVTTTRPFEVAEVVVEEEPESVAAPVQMDSALTPESPAGSAVVPPTEETAESNEIQEESAVDIWERELTQEKMEKMLLNATASESEFFFLWARCAEARAPKHSIVTL